MSELNASSSRAIPSRTSLTEQEKLAAVDNDVPTTLPHHATSEAVDYTESIARTPDEQLRRMIADEARCAVPLAVPTQRVIVDYSSPNIAKEMHVVT